MEHYEGLLTGRVQVPGRTVAAWRRREFDRRTRGPLFCGSCLPYLFLFCFAPLCTEWLQHVPSPLAWCFVSHFLASQQLLVSVAFLVWQEEGGGLVLFFSLLFVVSKSVVCRLLLPPTLTNSSQQIERTHTHTHTERRHADHPAAAEEKKGNSVISAPRNRVIACD